MSDALVVHDKQHATLGASVAARWMACPGSVRLSEPLGEQSGTSVYAQDGTRAHALAQLCLEQGKDPDFFVGMALEEGVVTDDMAEAVRVYVDYCRSLNAPAFWIERQFSLDKLSPPAPMFGTADFAALIDRTLHVVDLKFGQGVVVEAKGNKQLRYYGLGALLSLPDFVAKGVDNVVLTIVQPRAAHADGPIRGETLPVEELIGFAGELLAAARATQEPDAPLNPGSHCRFCPASGICPAQREHAQMIAQMDFADAPLAQPRAPETMTTTELVRVLDLVPMLEHWAAAVRAHVQAKLERGEVVPGYKLVERRATRKWADETAVVEWLHGKSLGDDEIMVSKLKSPAQIEKLVGKKNLPADFVSKVSSGYTLAPDADARPEVQVNPGEEFLAITAGTETDA